MQDVKDRQAVLASSEIDHYPSRCPVCGRGGEPPIPGSCKETLLPPDEAVQNDGSNTFERLVTLSDLSKLTGVPLFAIRKAVKRKEFPVHRVGNSRARVRLSEVYAAIAAAKKESAK